VLGNQINGGGGSGVLPLTGVPARIPLLLFSGLVFTLIGSAVRVALLHPPKPRGG
jgi:hypothetical protein